MPGVREIPGADADRSRMPEGCPDNRDIGQKVLVKTAESVENKRIQRFEFVSNKIEGGQKVLVKITESVENKGKYCALSCSKKVQSDKKCW
jgi:hypothetical protein